MTSTADLIERALADLPATIRNRRGPLSYRQAAAEAGVPFNTMCRIEKGGEPSVDTFIKLLRWANKNPNRRTGRGTMFVGQQTSRGAGRSDQ